MENDDEESGGGIEFTGEVQFEGGDDLVLGFGMESIDELYEHDPNRCGPAIELHQPESSDSEFKSSKLEWPDDDDDEETS